MDRPANVTHNLVCCRWVTAMQLSIFTDEINPEGGLSKGSKALPRSTRVQHGLTFRQQRFVNEYLIDLNATQAASRAGYKAHSAKSQGSRLLTKGAVRAAIDRTKTVRNRRIEAQQDRVVQDLAEIAFADGRTALGSKDDRGGADKPTMNKLDALEKLSQHLGFISHSGF